MRIKENVIIKNYKASLYSWFISSTYLNTQATRLSAIIRYKFSIPNVMKISLTIKFSDCSFNLIY